MPAHAGLEKVGFAIVFDLVLADERQRSMIRAERCSEIRPTSLNGHTRDLEGRLISCSHGDRRVHRTEYDGRIVVLAHHYQGKRLNSPNDVVVKSDRGRLVLGKPEAEAYGSVAS